MLLLTTIALQCVLLTLGAQAYPMSSMYQRHSLQKRHQRQPLDSDNGGQSDVVDSVDSQYESARLKMVARSGPGSETLAQSATNNDNGQVVVGKFKAPSPDKIQKSRVKSSSGAQVMSASIRVSDVSDDKSMIREKTVHGRVSGPPPNQRYVSAKIQVSDEGLNYPPSKLSADIHGNVAEIITAPPEALEGDFLSNPSSYFNADENDQQQALREAKRLRN